MSTQKPATFDEAYELGAYPLAVMWSDTTRWSAGPMPLEEELAELAVMSALVRWLDGWRPVNVHRAILGGATVEQVVAAHGGTLQEVADAWTRWADGQRDLRERLGRFGITGDEYGRVAAVFATALGRDGGESR